MTPIQYWIYLALVTAVLAWIAAQGLRSSDPVHRRLATVAVILAGISLLWFGAPPLAMLTGWQVLVDIVSDFERLVGVAWWLVLAGLAIALLERIGWPYLVGRGFTIPRLLPQIMRAVIVSIAFLGIVSALFEQSLTGLL